MAALDKPVLAKDLKLFCIEAMLRGGMRDPDARITSEVLVATDLWGIFSHGSKQLRGLMKNFRDKRMDLGAVAEIVSEGAAWALYDGHHAMPMVTSVRAMETAMSKAKDTGMGFVTVKDSGHFGAAAYYANMAAENDMLGISMTNVDPGVAVPGSRVPLLGTNPISYAVPAGKEKPILLDIATSVVAAGKIYKAQALGKLIPDNWLIDKDGVPTTDPAGYPKVGALLPMAGHKGYGLALLVEVLTGVISGGLFFDRVTSWILDIPDPVNQAHAFIVIDIGAIMPIDRFGERMDHMIRGIREAPKAKGTDRIYLPGEMEWEKMARAEAEGMALPEDVVMNLQGLAEDYHLDIADYF